MNYCSGRIGDNERKIPLKKRCAALEGVQFSVYLGQKYTNLIPCKGVKYPQMWASS